MRYIAIGLVVAASVGIAGCSSTKTSTTTITSAIAPTVADRQTPAFRACEKAIAKAAGTTIADVAVYNYLYSEAGTQVDARVTGSLAPWACIATNAGKVETVNQGSL